MTAMELIPAEVAKRNLKVADVFHDVLSTMFPSTRAFQGLQTSQQAPQPAFRGLADSIWTKKGPKTKPSPSVPFTSLSSSSLPSPRPRRPVAGASTSLSSPYHHPSSRASPNKPISMYRPANVDDAVGFMAAARALNQNSQAGAPLTTKDASSDQNGQLKTSTSPVGSPTAPEFVPSSASSSLAGNPAGSSGRVSPTVQDMANGLSGPSGFFVGSPTAPEFVPSSPNSLAGNPGDSQGRLSPAIKDTRGGQSPSFVGNPAAEEFMPSSTSSSLAGNPIEDFGPASTAREEITDHNIQDIGFGSNPQPTNPKMTCSEEKVTNVDDTVIFMAAVRALRQTHDMAPAVNGLTPSNIEEPSNSVDSAGFMEAAQDPEQQSETTVVSPVRDYFTPSYTQVGIASNVEDTAGFTPSSTKVDIASNVNDTVGSMTAAQGSEPTTNQLHGVPRSVTEPTPITSNEIGDVDDTAGFMAAARSLRRTPGMFPLVFEDETAGDVDDFVGSMVAAQDANETSRPSPAVSSEEEIFGEVDDASRSMTALNYPQISQPSMSPAEQFVSAATSPEKNLDDITANLQTAKISKLAVSTSSDVNENPTACSNDVDTVSAQQTNIHHVNGFAPESLQEKKKTGIVDDTAGFMAAARALKGRQASSSSMAPAEASHTPSEPNVVSPAPVNTSDTLVVEDEDRENLITFKTWGAPPPRDKAASQVRRIILAGLPATWATPTNALSLIHGGAIERVSITPSGNAHVHFCEHEACMAFYDRYPNGIGIGSHTVFIEIGQEVDVVSSQLTVNRSVGATRVVRAVGVDMRITMAQMDQLASGNNRKVEKILDNYTPNEVRTVHFRFCNLDDAVRFRSVIFRDENWESCNIQYGKDPCEIATGYHAD